MYIRIHLLMASFCNAKTSLLRGTTDILVRSDTLMIFRSGTDAASLNRSDVSALTETRRQKRTRKYAFDSATTQMRRIFSKDDKEVRTMLATTSPILQILNEKINVLSLSPEDRKLYESRMKLKSNIATYF